MFRKKGMLRFCFLSEFVPEDGHAVARGLDDHGRLPEHLQFVQFQASIDGCPFYLSQATRFCWYACDGKYTDKDSI